MEIMNGSNIRLFLLYHVYYETADVLFHMDIFCNVLLQCYLVNYMVAEVASCETVNAKFQSFYGNGGKSNYLPNARVC